MFKPSMQIEYCPICGTQLNVTQFMGYGITSGYNAQCDHCNSYNDIWTCGVRELYCGGWESESFMSSYGQLDQQDLQLEKYNFRKLNWMILKEKTKYKFKKVFKRI